MSLPHERGLPAKEKDLPARLEDIVRAVRDRHLDRIAAGYAVTAWVVVQAASIVVPNFEVSAQVLRAIIIFLLLGFPVTLIGAWFAVPHVSPHTGTAHMRKRPSKTGYALFAAFSLTFVAVAGDLSFLLSRSSPVRYAQAASVGGTPPKNSIAVLPFANMSGDPKKEYFSDGVAEELLDDLAGMPQLQVAARTSSFAFKNSNRSVRDIAHLLSVRSVLEGSVRESGRHLRISVELVDAASGYRLWSSIYDRDLTDILAVQEDIARAITVALAPQFLPHRAAMSAPGPINAEAYRAYLLGKHQLEPRTTEGTEAALSSFRMTVSLARDFADGFAALADANIVLADKMPERNDLIPAAEAAADTALRLDPKNVEALSARLDIALHKLDWPGAIRDAHALERAAPNSAKVLHEMFRFYYYTGFPDLALAAARGAARLDPLSFADRFNMASFLLHDDRYSEAVNAANAALALRPHQSLALAILCVAAANANQLPLASATGEQLSGHNAKGPTRSLDDTASSLCALAIAAAQNRTDDARKIVDALARGFPHNGMSAYEIGTKYAIVGDAKKADFWLARSYDNREFLLFLLPGDRIVPESFRSGPQYKALLERPLFRDWQNAHDQIASNLAGG